MPFNLASHQPIKDLLKEIGGEEAAKAMPTPSFSLRVNEQGQMFVRVTAGEVIHGHGLSLKHACFSRFSKHMRMIIDDGLRVYHNEEYTHYIKTIPRFLAFILRPSTWSTLYNSSECARQRESGVSSLDGMFLDKRSSNSVARRHYSLEGITKLLLP